jgi:glycerol-3-phosphate dehydrogenase
MDLNVLIVGGGIHGVGVLHDLATRGITGLLLVERHRLASGTSSRTTKLLHGGLRYLEHPLQWRLVREALRGHYRLCSRSLQAVGRPG